MQKIRITLVLAAMVLLVGITAAQTSTPTTQTGAASAQTAPQAPSAPGAATQPQAPQTTQPPSQTKTVDEELQLTPDQKQKIATIIDDENKQMGAVRDDSSMSPEQKQNKAVQIRQEGATRIRAVLSPDQLQKLTMLQERARQQQSTPSGATPKQ